MGERDSGADVHAIRWYLFALLFSFGSSVAHEAIKR